MDSLQTISEIYKVLDNKSAENIVVLKIRDISSIADYFVIASAATNRQTIALADNVSFELEKSGLRPRFVEGLSGGGWIVMDYYDVIVHIFLEDQREFYNLERLWMDAPAMDMTKNPPEAIPFEQKEITHEQN